MINYFLLALAFTPWVLAPSRPENPKPVTWSFGATVSHNRATLRITAHLQPGWHIYSLKSESGGPLPTHLSLEPSREWSSHGHFTETGHTVRYYDSTFMVHVMWYEDSVVFTKNIRLRKKDVLIKGTVEYMACRSELCLPAENQAFAIPVTQNK